MHSEYGIDLSEPGLLKRRSWRWFIARIRGLLQADTRIQRKLTPSPTPPSTPTPRRR